MRNRAIYHKIPFPLLGKGTYIFNPINHIIANRTHTGKALLVQLFNVHLHHLFNIRMRNKNPCIIHNNPISAAADIYFFRNAGNRRTVNPGNHNSLIFSCRIVYTMPNNNQRSISCRPHKRIRNVVILVFVDNRLKIRQRTRIQILPLRCPAFSTRFYIG